MTKTQVTTQSPPWPAPDERPRADVVIYDGQCRICTAQIKRLARWDWGRRLSYLSLHDPRVIDRYPDLSHEALMKEMYVVDRGGRRHAGASALRYLSRRIPTLWWLAPLLHLPGTLPVWRWLYQKIAQRRYRYGRIKTCDSGSCHLHAQ